MYRSLYAAAVGVCCLGLVFLHANAQNTPKTNNAKSNPETVEQLNLANSLIVYGQKNDQPAALLMAAQILHNCKYRNPTKKDFKTSKDGLKFEPLPEPTQLVQFAKKMDGASGLGSLVKQTEQILKETPRYRKGGPIVGVTYLRPNASGPSGVFEHTFNGGEPAQVICSTQGGGLMGVIVQDSITQQVVAKTQQPTAYVNLTWFVPTETDYKIIVFNHETVKQRVSWSVP